jgi:ssRNA-specific RNase YbeY (16S rRNA maturation enzyme)
MLQRDDLVQLIVDCGKEFKLSSNLDEGLIGMGSQLDSLDLVRFLVNVEARVNTDLQCFVVLVDDRAMSERNSPFRSINALTDYILRIANENNGDLRS